MIAPCVSTARRHQIADVKWITNNLGDYALIYGEACNDEENCIGKFPLSFPTPYITAFIRYDIKAVRSYAHSYLDFLNVS